MAFATLLAGLTSLVFVKRADVEAHLKDWVLPHVAEQLGREVQVETVRVKLFPLRAELEQVRVAGLPGEPALLETAAARASLELWPLLASRGEDVRFGSIQFDAPRLNLVRDDDGCWNFQNRDARHGLRSLVIADDAPRDETQDRLITVGDLRIRGATISLSSPEGNVVLDHVDVDARALSSEEPIRLDIAAAYASDRPNLNGTVSVLPDGRLTGTVEASSLDVANLRSLMPARLGRVLVGGRASLQARFEAGDGRLVATGQVDARKLSYGAQPADATFEFSVDTQPPRRSDPIVRMSKGRIHGPGLDLRGRAWVGRNDDIRFDLAGPDFDLDKMLSKSVASPAHAHPRRGAAPQTLVKGTVVAPADETAISGTITVDALDLETARQSLPENMRAMLTGGRARVVARFTEDLGRLDASGRLATRNLSVRNQPFDASFDFKVRRRPAARTQSSVRLSNIRLRGPGVDLGGSAWVGRASEIGFDLAASRLDVDALLSTRAAAGPAPTAAAANAEGEATQAMPAQRTTAAAPAALKTVVASGRVAVKQLVVRGMSASNVSVSARLRAGEVELERANAQLYGGTIDLSGSRLKLAGASPSWEVRATVANLDFGRVMRQAGVSAPAEGELDALLDVRGNGLAWTQARASLAGSGSFWLERGASEAAGAQPAQQSSDLSAMIGNLQGRFTVDGGALRFDEPLQVQMTQGTGLLVGTVGFDGKLDLRGKGIVNPRETGLAVLQLRKPITTQLALGGAVDAPLVHVAAGGIVNTVIARSPPAKLFRAVRNLFRR